MKNNKYMTVYNLYSGFTTFLIFILIGFSIFLPNDTLGIKTATLSLIIIFNVPVIVQFFLRKSNIKYLFLLVVSPLILYLVSLLTYFNVTDNIKYFYVYTYMWIVPVIMEYKIDYKKYFMFFLYVMTFLLIICVVLDALSLYTVENNFILMYLNNSGNAKISTSPNAIFHYVLFLNTSPLLIVLMLYQLNKKKYLLSLITLMSLCFTGTRANIYLSIVSFFILYFISEKSVIKRIFILIITFLGYLIMNDTFKEKISNINHAKSYGDAIRDLTMESIILDIKDGNFFTFIFGRGPNKPYFNYGRMEVSQYSELSYMELIRQIGIFGILLFLLFILDLLFNLFKQKKYWLFIGLGSYLVISTIDPFLFTSTGFILYSLCYYEILEGEP